ncbi:1-phosphofructokinase family hexose kinase [Paenibacillus hamazuiensis]|uniref:1-phosphofructokinase family hexose kinase n=1 Tax=Paenibacillus hamazuiensis TaxID=2936508 RepID=UPI00200F6614
MISTFTLNAAVDKFYVIDDFQLDSVNRVKKIIAEPGGKGNNVAKVAHLLGSKVTASGFLGGANGQIVHQELQKRGISSEPVFIGSLTREAFAIADHLRGTLTEILEPGPRVEPQEWEQLRRKAGELSARSKVICFSGSLPAGAASDAYASLIGIAKEAGALTILDSSGEPLRIGIESAPFLCKPNRDELVQIVGKSINSAADIIAAAESILARGVRLVVVSMDKDGSIVVCRSKAWQVKPPVIRTVNTVGCGDAMVAGIASYFDRKDAMPDEEEWVQAVMLGTAAAASNAMHEITGHIDIHEVHDLLKEVQVTEFLPYG